MVTWEGVCSNAKENGQIQPSNAVRNTWNAGSHHTLHLGFQPTRKMATTFPSSKLIRGIPAET